MTNSIDTENENSIVERPEFDARMRDRWIVARRDEGRRRLRVLMTVIIALGTIGLAYAVAASPLLGAGTVKIRGAKMTTADVVRAAAEIEDGEALLFLDSDSIARRVERLPYVSRAQVSTELPSTVVIRVFEREAIAWIRTADSASVVLVDGSGRVLEQLVAPPLNLPEIVGASGSGRLGQRFESGPFRAMTAFPGELRRRVKTLTVVAGQARLVLLGDPPEAGEVFLGPLVAVRAKAGVALAVLDALRARGERVGVIDVSVADAPVTR